MVGRNSLSYLSNHQNLMKNILQTFKKANIFARLRPTPRCLTLNVIIWQWQDESTSMCIYSMLTMQLHLRTSCISSGQSYMTSEKPF